MTFIQRTLGKNYKWFYLFLFYLKSLTTYFWTDLFWYSSQIIQLFLVIFVWQISNRADNQTIIQYILMANIFYTLSSNHIYWIVGNRIYEGKITSELISPTSLFSHYFFGKSIGYAVKNIVSIGFAILPILIWYRSNLNFEGNYIILIMLPIAFTIKYFINMCIGFIGFWVKENFGTMNLYENILPLVTGSLVPLSILNIPILEKLPTAYLLHHPMQIYLGKYDTNQIFQTFVGGIIWCFVLWILARLVFKAGLKKNEAVGL
jgi:ABC-2 type transport system permease protein